MKNLKEIAKETNAWLVNCSNGDDALIRFDSFEEAERIANKYDLEIELFTRKDGQDWKRTYDVAYEPMEISAADFGETALEYSRDYADNFFEDEMKSLLEEMMDDDNTTAEDIFKYIESCKRLYDEIVKLKEDEIVIVEEGCYPITEKKIQCISLTTQRLGLSVL